MSFTIKIRTSPGAPMTAEYRCPVHGLFEATVQRDAAGDPPATQRCPAPCRVSGLSHGGTGPDHGHDTLCRLSSPWCISAPGVHTQFVISAYQGKPDPKPRPETMDTRLIAEGRKNQFRKERQAVRDADRHRRVKELLK